MLATASAQVCVPLGHSSLYLPLQLGYLLAVPLNERLSQLEDFNMPGMQFMVLVVTWYFAHCQQHSSVPLRRPVLPRGLMEAVLTAIFQWDLG